MTRFLTAIVSWLRAGYPEGIPPTDTFAVLAFLTRRLSNDDVEVVANHLMEQGVFDKVDIGVAISKLTDEMPGQEDMERVRYRLAANGWPLDDVRDIDDEIVEHPDKPTDEHHPGAPE